MIPIVLQKVRRHWLRRIRDSFWARSGIFGYSWGGGCMNDSNSSLGRLAKKKANWIMVSAWWAIPSADVFSANHSLPLVYVCGLTFVRKRTSDFIESAFVYVAHKYSSAEKNVLLGMDCSVKKVTLKELSVLHCNVRRSVCSAIGGQRKPCGLFWRFPSVCRLEFGCLSLQNLT